VLDTGGDCTGVDISEPMVAGARSRAELEGIQARFLLTRLGPLGPVLADRDVSTRVRIAEAARPAFDPYVEGTEVCFTAACWMVGAHD